LHIALWILMAVLAAAAALVVLVPLSRGSRRASASAAALAIYRDQIDELDRDLSRGLIRAEEAEAARTEIARRLIRAGEGEPGTANPGSVGARRAAAVAAIAAPILAFGGYLALGSPEMPDQPLSARLDRPLEQQDVQTLVARVESHLAGHPEDGSGWEVIAPVYLRMGRYDDAVRAYGNAIRILGSTAARESALGDAIVRTNDGLVTADARAAFERALKLDPKSVAARFYLAIALGQDGRKEDALAAWQALLKDAPADAAWAPIARQWVARLQGGAPAPATAGPAPGPSEAEVAAAESMTPEQRTAMINGMVAQLAGKLAANPDDAEGWARLVRAYGVLGRTDEAKAALAKARTALAGKPDGLSMVEAEARAAGIEPVAP
jgi:cytochrome c-type biogenesis protein CcmH